MDADDRRDLLPGWCCCALPTTSGEIARRASSSSHCPVRRSSTRARARPARGSPGRVVSGQPPATSSPTHRILDRAFVWPSVRGAGAGGTQRGRIPMLTRTRASLSPLRDTHGWPHTRDRPRPTGTRAPRVGRTASSSLPRQRRRGSESARVTIHPTRWLSPNTTPANQQPFHVQRKICARGTPPPSKAVGLLAGDASGRRRRGATTSAGIREGRAGGRRKVGTSRQQPVRRRQTEMKKCPSELQLEAFIRGSGEGAAESEPTGSGPSEPGGSGAFSPGGFGFGDTVSTAKPTANIMAALATETSPSLWI